MSDAETNLIAAVAAITWQRRWETNERFRELQELQLGTVEMHIAHRIHVHSIETLFHSMKQHVGKRGMDDLPAVKS